MAKPRRKRRPKRRSVRKSLVYMTLGAAVCGVALLVAWLVARRESGVGIDEILASYREDVEYGGLTIGYPLDETLFPPEIVAPTFHWKDSHGDSDAWVVAIEFQDGQQRERALCLQTQWTPSDERWEMIKRRSLETWAKVTVLGVNRATPQTILSAAEMSFKTSSDEVGAPLFYREVNLPFVEAVKDPARHIRWRFGPVSSKEPPPIVLDKLPVCGNCHSFSADGRILGMDVDYANDKGSYVIDGVAEEMRLSDRKIITWSDYKREDGELTFGLLSQVSPDGRYVVSTVKDRSVFVPKDDLAFSQLFFPIQGILVVYDRNNTSFHALPGADDKRFVQSNPTWSPDGKYVVFARSEAYRLRNLETADKVLLTEEECAEFLEEGKTFLFDLYRIPFNGGKGGEAEPLQGASRNGMSNYFAKYSPDGKWIVFCKAKSFMLLQPDSRLYIIPAEGGEARELRCNTRRMNSWHSWSPNGKWLVFSSKANTAYTQLFLTHVDEQGQSSPAVVLSRLTSTNRAANIPEFVHAKPDAIKRIRKEFVDDVSYCRAAGECLKSDDYEGAARAYQKALELNPSNMEALVNLGESLLRLGRLDEAKSHLVKAIALEPDTKQAHLNLACVLGEQRKYGEAIEHCRRALRIDSEYAVAHRVLGAFLLENGRRAEGKQHLTEALRLDADDPLANCALADALRTEGELSQAVPLYEHALERAPRLFPALLGLASIRAMSRDPALRNGNQAVELAARACELTRHKHPQALDTLAAAYAEAGRFSEGVSAAEQALWMAHSAGNDAYANAIAQRIELYKQHRPFHHLGTPRAGDGEKSAEGGKPSAAPPSLTPPDTPGD